MNIDYGKYIREKTREYNYIVTYKYLKEKNSQETRQIMKLLPKSVQEIIFEKIEEVKKQLQDKQNQTPSKQYQLNNILNDLYKEYKMATGSRRHTRQSRTSSLANQTTDSLRMKEMTNRGRASNNTVYSGSTPKSGRLHFVFKRERVRPPGLL